MHMTTATPLRNSDWADEFAAGRPFPARDALAKATPASARALFAARRAFWLAAADTYRAQVANGCTDAAHDLDDALAQAQRYSV